MSQQLLLYLVQTTWALDETVLGQMADIVARHAEGIRLAPEEIQLRIAAARAAGGALSSPGVVRAAVAGGANTLPGGWYKAGSVGVIPIAGVISKYSAGVSDISQPEGTSVEQIRQCLRDSDDDDETECRLLHIESPGGAVDGLAELGDELAASASRKPIIAYGEKMCSGAYWLGSQADEIVAGKSSVVGSIGVYTVAMDASRAYENAGFKVNVVRAGAMKGAGVRGAPITAEQIAESQRFVDSYYTMFVNAVASGRGIPVDAARAMGDGRVHIGEAARVNGMVDSIATFDDTLARLQAVKTTSARSAAKRSPIMSQATKTEADFRAEEKKRVTDIKAAFPDDAAFALDVIESGKSLLEAKADYADVLKKRLTDASATHAKALEEAKAANKQPATAAAVPPPGNAPVKTDRGTDAGDAAAAGAGSVRQRFDAIWAQNVTALGGPTVANVKARAMSKTIAENHDLHQEMLAEAKEAAEAKSKTK